MAFQPHTFDFEKSPYTGLTRESWIEAAQYLLDGIFANIKSFDDPVVMPRKETKVSYPHSADAVWEFKAEYFEGLTRSMFIAAPMIHINPRVTAGGYCLRDYYKAQILHSCTSGHPLSVGSYEELVKMTGDATRTFQQTVETSALVICLWITKEEIWDTYTREEKDLVAEFLMGYANGNTVPQNWRLFNMLDLAFLDKMGYPIDREIMLEHAQAILNYYAGNGWYRDGHAFDYYSCWAFNVYTAFWNEWYGYEKVPYVAAKFEDYSNELMKTYADFFDKDGWTNMWGRSNIYRFAAASPFDGNLMMRNSTADPGRSRRIASGSLMQFMGRDDFLFKGVPTLGFYGQFTPLVQGYSCAESPFWMGKAFLCLHLPADHPFWTAKENNGTWEDLRPGEVKETVLDGPALCFTNHASSGETILRTGKVLRNTGDEHSMWNYSKLSFNTKYPWEAAPSADVESEQYVLKDLTSQTTQKCNVTFWAGEKDGVLYRRQFFNYAMNLEGHWVHAVNAADFAVPCGIFRADKLRAYRRPVSVTLGSYGFPDNGTEIIRKEKDGAKAIILKGHDSIGNEKQLAMTIYDGWDSIDIIKSVGTNPESEHSIVIYASLKREKQYGYTPYYMISQVITKESLEDFSEDEIFPVKSIVYADPEECGGYGPVVINMKDRTRKIIDFEQIEGRLTL